METALPLVLPSDPSVITVMTSSGSSTFVNPVNHECVLSLLSELYSASTGLSGYCIRPTGKYRTCPFLHNSSHVIL